MEEYTFQIESKHNQYQVLLCKRAIQPRQGFWTLPAGFMELDESLPQAAIREAEEEAGISVKLGPLFMDIPVYRR